MQHHTKILPFSIEETLGKKKKKISRGCSGPKIAGSIPALIVFHDKSVEMKMEENTDVGKSSSGGLSGEHMRQGWLWPPYHCRVGTKARRAACYTGMPARYEPFKNSDESAATKISPGDMV